MHEETRLLLDGAPNHAHHLPAQAAPASRPRNLCIGLFAALVVIVGLVIGGTMLVAPYSVSLGPMVVPDGSPFLQFAQAVDVMTVRGECSLSNRRINLGFAGRAVTLLPESNTVIHFSLRSNLDMLPATNVSNTDWSLGVKNVTGTISIVPPVVVRLGFSLAALHVVFSTIALGEAADDTTEATVGILVTETIWRSLLGALMSSTLSGPMFTDSLNATLLVHAFTASLRTGAVLRNRDTTLVLAASSFISLNHAEVVFDGLKSWQLRSALGADISFAKMLHGDGFRSGPGHFVSLGGVLSASPLRLEVASVGGSDTDLLHVSLVTFSPALFADSIDLRASNWTFSSTPAGAFFQLFMRPHPSLGAPRFQWRGAQCTVGSLDVPAFDVGLLWTPGLVRMTLSGAQGAIARDLSFVTASGSGQLHLGAALVSVDPFELSSAPHETGAHAILVAHMKLTSAHFSNHAALTFTVAVPLGTTAWVLSVTAATGEVTVQDAILTIENGDLEIAHASSGVVAAVTGLRCQVHVFQGQGTWHFRGSSSGGLV
jgi:hypothetical protein